MEVRTGKAIYTWDLPVPVKCVEFSSCGNYIVSVLDSVMGYPGSVNVYEIKRDEKDHTAVEFVAEPIFTIETEKDKELAPVCVAGWSIGSKYIIVGHKDGAVSKYEVNLKDHTYRYVESIRLHSQAVSDIQFSPDRTYFITSSRDATAHLVDVESFKVLKNYDADCPLNCACITPLKDFVILGGGQAAKDVTTTSASEGKFEARFYHKIFEDEIGRVKGHFGPLNCVAVSPQGTSYTSVVRMVSSVCTTLRSPTLISSTMLRRLLRLRSTWHPRTKIQRKKYKREVLWEEVCVEKVR